MKKIELTRGKVALVSVSDYKYINSFKWSAVKINNCWYAVRSQRVKGDKKSIRFYMHRVIVGVTDRSILVDHKDGDGLNNQRANLRKCNKSQNAINRKASKGSTSKYIGVCFITEKKKWQAQIMKDGIQYKLGRYFNEVDAALAYNLKATELHGEFAKLNIIENENEKN